MECYICLRSHDPQRLPFLCPVDGRNRIYEGRMQNLQLVLENESLQGQITELLNDSARHGVDDAIAAHRIAEDRTEQIIAAADRLRDEMKSAREELKKRKAAVAARRSDLATASQGLVERRAQLQRDVEKSTQMLHFRWSQTAEDLAGTRAFLCREAVKLYGLKRVRKGSTSRYDYYLGRLPVIDLVTMESQTPEIISTSLAHMAHILMLVAHYLAIRLPAEITLPHRDYPRPTIFNLVGSYHHGDLSFPGTPGATTILNEPRTTDSAHLPRPRPLYIDKPLRQLLKDDPSSSSFFLEGVTLLAYDIAWLCCSQGVSIGDKGSFEDICNMGKNLYGLLLSSCLQGPGSLVVKTPNHANNQTASKEDGAESLVGRYSHGTMFYFLGGADGTELLKTFKLPSPMKLADKLRKKLLGDSPAPDWEILDDDAWKVEDGPNEHGAQQAQDKTKTDIPKPESKGWMKVKSR